MKWTREKPTKAGWWWYKDDITAARPLWCTRAKRQITAHWHNGATDSVNDLDGQWSDQPIPEPEEP